jgi:hypothetical protein
MKYIKLVPFLVFVFVLSSYIPHAKAGGGPTPQVLGGSTSNPSAGASGLNNTSGSSTTGSTGTTANNGSTVTNGTGPGLDITITPFGDIGIKFADGDLIKSPNEKKVYIMFHGLKTAAVSMETLKRLGLETRPIKILTFTQTETVPYGNPIILK